VTFAPADDVLRSQLRLADGEGLVITDIVADGPSAKAGLRRHDVLVKLDGKRLTTVEAFNTQIQEIKDRQVTATLFRAGKETSLELTPQLSTTGEIRGNPYLATVVLDKSNLAGNQWTSRLNLNTLQIDPIQGIYQPNVVHWLETTGGLNATANPALETTDAATAHPAAQIAQLKRQLEELQKSLAALEATLQSPTTEQKPEQKSEQSPKPQTEQPADKPQP
jgi:hypothetical protein